MKDFSRRTFAKGVAVALALPAVGVELLAKQSIPKIVSKREPIFNYAGVFIGHRWVTENGIVHREDGPAVELADSTKQWWLNGQRHREDGPAVECADGTKCWYLNGKRHREDGPAILSNNKLKKEWWFEGKRHREDGPAIILGEGSYKGWWLNGECHREDGPAVEWFDGKKEYWYEGKKLPLLSKRATLIQLREKEREENLFT